MENMERLLVLEDDHKINDLYFFVQRSPKVKKKTISILTHI